MKKLFISAFCLFLIFTLVSCDNEIADSVTVTNKLIQDIGIEQNEQVITPSPTAWTVKYLEYPENIYISNNVLNCSNTYYLSEEKVFKVNMADSIITYDMNGNITDYMTVTIPDGYIRSGISLTEDGYYLTLRKEKSDTVYRIEKYDWNGKITETVFESIEGMDSYARMPGANGGIKEYGYPVTINKIIRHTDGLYYFLCRTEVFAYTEDGEQVLKWEHPSSVFSDIFVYDGVLYIKDFANYLYIADIENKTVITPDYPELPEIFGEFGFDDTSRVPESNGMNYEFGNYYRAYGDGYDIYYMHKDGVYGHNYTDEEAEPEFLLSYSNSGLERNMVTITQVFDQCHMLATVGSVFETSDNIFDRDLALLIYDPEKAAETKKSLNLVHMGNLNSSARAAISHFNMTNAEYRIDLHDYSQYNTDELPTGGIDRLDLEMSSGQYPDIILLHDDMDVMNYTRKGYFKNLYDAGFDPSKLSKAVRQTAEFAGGLYSLPMTFEFTALLNREGITSLTLDDLYTYYAEYGEMTLPQFKRELLIECMIEGGVLGGFIDYDGAKCDFNNAEFVKLLDFWRNFKSQPQMRTHPYQFAYRVSPENQQLVKGRESLFHSATYYAGEASIRSFNFLYDGYNYSYSGFPTTEGSGVSISTENAFAVTTACAYPEAATKLLELMFNSPEAAEYLWKYEMPSNTEILRGRFDKMYLREDALIYFNVKSNSISNTVFSTDAEERLAEKLADPNVVPIYVTAEEIDGFFNSIVNAETRGTDDPKILEIVWDELTPFLAGQDTAANTANRINSRVGIYLAERYS